MKKRKHGPKATPTQRQINRRLALRKYHTPEGFAEWLPTAYELWSNYVWTYEEVADYLDLPRGTVGNYLWAYKKHLVEIGAIATGKRPAQKRAA